MKKLSHLLPPIILALGLLGATAHASWFDDFKNFVNPPQIQLGAATSTLVRYLFLDPSQTGGGNLCLERTSTGLVVTSTAACGAGGGGGLASSTQWSEGLIPVIDGNGNLYGFAALSYNSSTNQLDANLDHLATGTQRINLGTTSTNPLIYSTVSPLYIHATTTPPGASLINPETGERNGSGCFRINSGAIDDTETGRRIPGTIHLGSECTQGWGDAYVDVNDVNVSSSLERRLMHFWYTNVGSGGGIGASIKINTKNSGSQTLNPQYVLSFPTAGTYSNGQNMRFDNTLTLSTSGITVNDFDIIRMYNNSLSGPATGSVLSRYSMIHGSFALSNKVSSTVMIYGNRPSIASQAADNNIGLFMPRFAAGLGKRNWGALLGERLGMASNTAIAFDETNLATNNHDTVTTYGDTTLTYITAYNGLDLTIDSVSSTIWYSTSTLHRLPQIVSSTLQVNQTSTFLGNVGVGTTTPATSLVVENQGNATTTITVGKDGFAGCIKMQDTDGAGFTYLKTLNGVLTASTASCE